MAASIRFSDTTRKSMAKIVKTAGSDACPANSCFKRTCNALNDVSAPFEDTTTPWGALNAPQNLSDGFIHGDMAVATVLRLFHCDHAFDKVDLAPIERQDFPAAHSRIYSNDKDRKEVRCHCSLLSRN